MNTNPRFRMLDADGNQIGRCVRGIYRARFVFSRRGAAVESYTIQREVKRGEWRTFFKSEALKRSQ